MAEENFEMRKMPRPQRALPASSKPLLDNIVQVKKTADGEWYLIGRFRGPNGAAGRMRTLHARQKAGARGLERVEFAAHRLTGEYEDLTEDGEYSSGLWCRWAGVKGKSAEDSPRPPAALRAVGGRGRR